MLLTACQSTEYIHKPTLPAISFPTFPALQEYTRNVDETVTVPGEWLIRLEEYRIRVEETEKTYNEIKAMYNDEQTEKSTPKRTEK